MKKYIYSVSEVVRVVDGDTVELMVDYGFKEFGLKTFRIMNLDTYETRKIKRNGIRVTDAEVQLGYSAKNYAQDIFNTKTIDIIQTVKDKAIIGNRYLADIFFTDGTNFTMLMKAAGFDRNLDKHNAVTKGV
jgi:endonuclease YncB( thermonuclease family)